MTDPVGKIRQSPIRRDKMRFDIYGPDGGCIGMLNVPLEHVREMAARVLGVPDPVLMRDEGTEVWTRQPGNAGRTAKRWAWTRRTIEGVDLDVGEVEANTARLALREVRRLCWGGPSCGSPNGGYTKAWRGAEVLEIQEVKP